MLLLKAMSGDVIELGHAFVSINGRTSLLPAGEEMLMVSVTVEAIHGRTVAPCQGSRVNKVPVGSWFGARAVIPFVSFFPTVRTTCEPHTANPTHTPNRPTIDTQWDVATSWSTLPLVNVSQMASSGPFFMKKKAPKIIESTPSEMNSTQMSA